MEITTLVKQMIKFIKTAVLTTWCLSTIYTTSGWLSFISIKYLLYIIFIIYQLSVSFKVYVSTDAIFNMLSHILL